MRWQTNICFKVISDVLFLFYSQRSLPGLSFCLCNPTSLCHHFFQISKTGLPFRMQDNPLLHLNYLVSHQHPPSPSQWLFSEPHFVYQKKWFVLCHYAINKRVNILTGKISDYSLFSFSCFCDLCPAPRDLWGGGRQEKNRGCHFWGLKSYTFCCVLVKGIQLV